MHLPEEARETKGRVVNPLLCGPDNSSLLERGSLPEGSTTDGFVVGLGQGAAVHPVLDRLPAHSELLSDISQGQDRFSHQQHSPILPLDVDAVKVYAVKVSYRDGMDENGYRRLLETQKAPLRKVVDRRSGGNWRDDVLECGHTFRVFDTFSTPAKRRCRECL